MEELTISEVARRAGIRPSAIRYYESIAVLPPPRRVNGRRRYPAAIIERLAFIQVAQRLGFSLSDVQGLLSNRDTQGLPAAPLAERWQALAQQKLADVETLIRQANDIRNLLVQGLECGCPNLLDCIQCVLVKCHGARRAAARD